MSFFERTMRNAAPILFWTSALLLIGGLATTLLLEQGFNPYGSGSVIEPRSLLSAIYQGLASAALPFIGAAIVWNLQDGRKDHDR